MEPEPEPEPAAEAAGPAAVIDDDTSQGAHSFAVALDGSRLSDHAFKFCAGLLKKRRSGPRQLQDTMLALHVSAPPGTHEVLDKNLAKDVIQANSASKASEEYGLELTWQDEERQSNQTTGQTVCSLCKKHLVQFLVVGLFGRKNDGSKLLGDCSKTILKEETAADVFVVKPGVPLPTKGEPEIWCVASDFSANARHALDVVLTLMAKTDKLYVLHITRFEAFAGRVEDAHMNEVRAKNREAEFVLRQMEPGEHVGEVVSAFAASKGVHVLAMGHQGHSRALDGYHAAGSAKQIVTERHVGSLSHYVICNAKATVLICKTTGRHVDHHHTM